MRSALLPLGLVLASVLARPGYAQAVYPGCRTPPPAARALHVAPGAPTGDGTTAAAPISLPLALSSARGGDTLRLASGDYGMVTLTGDHGDFVTVTAEPGQRPVLKGLSIGGYTPHAAARWRVSGLLITGGRNSGLNPQGWQNHPPLIEVRNSEDIIVEGNRIETFPGDYGWPLEIRGQGLPEQLMSAAWSFNANCVAFTRNTVHNVFGGFGVGGDTREGKGLRILLADNEIRDFSGDGIDHFGSHVAILRNRIENAHDECHYACIHTDAIQGWNYNGLVGIINVDVVIAGNRIVDKVGAMVTNPSGIQGITIFDGKWDGVRIENNTVVAATGHAITLSDGVQRAVVVNNTALSRKAGFPAWIFVNDVGPGPYAIVVRNNISSTFKIAVQTAGVTSDHNVVVADPKALVRTFDPDQGRYDLHLSKQSAAIGAGAADDAPKTDIEGRTRGEKIDAGAYAAGP